jgi:hypothetical protein
MGWQDYVVWAIGLLVAALIVRRSWCFFRGRKRGGCASCASADCPLKHVARRRK